MDFIGNYKILRTIVEKGPSKVCIAEHKKLGRKTFLKIYSGVDSDLIQRFEREARIVADLNHESIVSIYDFGEFEGKYFISMEYVDGCNLAEFLKSNTLTVEQVISFSLQIAKSVSILHKKGYVHRDLKPENILIDQNNTIKITDFGIAFHEALNHVTSEGNVLGTPLYMSPEQINNVPLDQSSDVFSLGIIFYQMVTGQNPFWAERFGEIFSNILTIEPAPLNKYNPELPDWFVDLVDDMLQKASQKRIKNASLIVERIEKFVKKQVSENFNKKNKNEEVKKEPFFRWKFVVPFSSLIIVLFFVFYFQFIKENDANSAKQQEIVNADSSDFFIPFKIDGIGTSNKNDTSANVDIKSITKEDEKSLKNSQPVPVNAHIVDKPEIQTSFFIETWPWCRVYLDYEFIDETQMKEPKSLKPGRYLLSLQNPDYPTWSDSIDILSNQLNTFSFNLDSIYFKLTLNVSPWGDVYIDGKYIGTTPIKPVYLTRENHFILIKNEFYETWQDSIFWNGKEQVDKKIKLKKTEQKS